MRVHHCAINIGGQSPFLSSAKRGFPFVLSSSYISQEKLAIHLLYFTASSFTEMWELTWTCAVERRFAPFPMYQSLREELVQACSMGNMGWVPPPPFLPCMTLTGHWKLYTGLPFPFNRFVEGFASSLKPFFMFHKKTDCKMWNKTKISVVLLHIRIGYKPIHHSFGLRKFL